MPMMFHPWETGWDNSPRWDFLSTAGLRPSRRYERLDRRHVAAEERPADRDYDSFLALAEIIDGSGYDGDAVFRASPFAVHDVVADALWLAAAGAVDEMRAELGDPPEFGPEALQRFRSDFETVHRHGGAYLDVDAKSGAPIDVLTAAGAAARPDQVWPGYRAAADGALLVPTVPPSAPEFEPGRYWRGPVWISVNWLVIQAGVDELREATLELVAEHGFWEYFDALTGEGRGIDGFTWTAALALDLLS
jgi:hypothetical protein